jgi:D-sedoheptulose 7-phosphate isomerase
MIDNLIWFKEYFSEVKLITDILSSDHLTSNIYDMIHSLKNTRDLYKGRVFVLGVGGSAGNASHMVNDLRKLCNIEAYCPSDNVSELSARANDDGFETFFEEYLKVSNFSAKDTIFILSVGGGNLEKNVSVGLIKAIKYAKNKNGNILSIVGKTDGYAYNNSNISLCIPDVNNNRITPHSEAFQAIVWHMIVSHPDLQVHETKW